MVKRFGKYFAEDVYANMWAVYEDIRNNRRFRICTFYGLESKADSIAYAKARSLAEGKLKKKGAKK